MLEDAALSKVPDTTPEPWELFPTFNTVLIHCCTSPRADTTAQYMTELSPQTLNRKYIRTYCKISWWIRENVKSIVL